MTFKLFTGQNVSASRGENEQAGRAKNEKSISEAARLLDRWEYWTCNSMNNLLSNCGLVEAKIRASDKDLSVKL